MTENLLGKGENGTGKHARQPERPTGGTRKAAQRDVLGWPECSAGNEREPPWLLQ